MTFTNRLFRALLLGAALMIGVGCASTQGMGTLPVPDFSTNTISLLKSNGLPIACTIDTDCNQPAYISIDVCYIGAACNGARQCEATMWASCANPATAPYPLNIGCASNHTSCDDGNPCTTDWCNPMLYDGTGGCQHPQTSGGLKMTCGSGSCSVPVYNCFAGMPNPVTNCTGAFALVEGGTCDDNNACTAGDACHTGACVPGPVTSCDDGNLCTDDSCNPASGCVHVNNTATCTDGNACTGPDACSGGACVSGPALNCNDNNPCTDDSCDPTSGCKHANNTLACNDGNACTGPDACSGGVCVGASVNCDDGNACTDDSCDPTSGCKHANNTLACNDGNACTGPDACLNGVCVPGSLVVCNDNNPCTNDSCDPVQGCVYMPNAATCTDNNVCTVGDACASGSCVPGPLQNCDDGNKCTLDSCNPASGCVHVNQCEPEAGHCSDGIDNDMNGLTDCQDLACNNDPACYQEACTAAATIVCGGQWSDQTTSIGKMNGYACTPASDYSGGEKVVSFTASVDGTVYAVLAGEKAQNLLLLTDTCAPSSCTHAGYSAITASVAKGHTYYFVVDTLGGDSGGPFTLYLDCK